MIISVKGENELLMVQDKTLDILFSSNHNIHKSSSGHCFWTSDPLIERFFIKSID